MNRILSSLFFTVLVTSACTSEQEKIEELIIESARPAIEAEITNEANAHIARQENLKTNYINIVKGKTEYVVSGLVIQGNSATAVLTVKTVYAPARKALMEIINKRDIKKSDLQFNVSDALTMVYQHLKIPTSQSSEMQFSYTLSKSNDWKVVSAKRL